MKILVLGSHGMLGNEFMDILQHQSYEVHGVDKENLDVRRAEEVRNYIQSQEPDVVINTTGYTDVDGAEQNTEEAYALNAYAPKYIAEASRDVDATLIHFSTDFVFNGQDASGYTEEQEPQQSVNTYGASKRRGEEYVMETDPFYYLIRTSWLFGKHGRNFVQHIRSKALQENQEDALRVVNDQYGKPTYTKDLVHATLRLLQDNADYGIYHLTNSTKKDHGITKFDLASTVVEMLGAPVYVSRVSSSEFPTEAPRPQYSVLHNTKRPALRGYEEAVHEYVIEESW